MENSADGRKRKKKSKAAAGDGQKREAAERNPK